MSFIVHAVLIFVELFTWCLIAWVLIGYLPLLGIPFSLPILDRIVLPPLDLVRKTVPTAFSWIDFSPLILFLVLEVIVRLLVSIPGV